MGAAAAKPSISASSVSLSTVGTKTSFRRSPGMWRRTIQVRSSMASTVTGEPAGHSAGMVNRRRLSMVAAKMVGKSHYPPVVKHVRPDAPKIPKPSPVRFSAHCRRTTDMERSLILAPAAPPSPPS